MPENEQEKPKETRLKRQLLKPKKPINYWKWAFLSFITILLVLVLWVGSKVFKTPPNWKGNQGIDVTQQSGSVPFSVSAKKDEINKVIAHYLSNFTEDSDIQYELVLDEKVELLGTFQLFGHDMNFSMYFDPFVMENGDVQLKAESVAVGELDLPMEHILSYVANNYKIPKWVEVNSKKDLIIFHLDQFTFAGGSMVSANRIDLPNDDIQLEVYFPLKNLEMTKAKEEKNDSSK